MSLRRLLLLLAAALSCPAAARAIMTTDFTAASGVATTDIVWCTLDPTGTPLDRQCSFGQIFDLLPDYPLSHLTFEKTSGTAGLDCLYEANSTDLDVACEQGPASMAGDTSYSLLRPTAGPTAIAVRAQAAQSGGTGAPATPYQHAGSWLLLDTDLSSVSGSDDTIPSAKATKVYADTKQAALTYPVTGVASPTAGYLTKWGASGNTLADALKFGTLTDTKYCTYSTASGLVCTSDGTGSMTYPGAGIAVSTGSAWGTSKTTPSGVIVGDTDTQTLTSKTLTAPVITTNEVNGSAAATLTAAQVSSTTVYNTGQAAADVALTLPTAAAGYNLLLTVGTARANKWGVRAGASDKIYLLNSDGTISAGSDNGYARFTNAQIGQAMACWTFKTDAYDWQCKAISVGTSALAAN